MRPTPPALIATLVLALAQPAAASPWGDFWKTLTGGDNATTEAAAEAVGSAALAALGEEDIAAALREALEQGTRAVVEQVSASDGFNADPRIHIPLPEQLEPVRGLLARVGMDGFADELELRLNRAAEAAAPEAGALFAQAIADMSIADARAILDGPPDAATSYFHSRMAEPLTEAMMPSVNEALAEAGAVRAYESLLGEYQSLPFVPQVRADLTRHVVDRTVDGVFLYLGEQEAAIRSDPQRWTTDLLERVFGG